MSPGYLPRQGLCWRRTYITSFTHRSNSVEFTVVIPTELQGAIEIPKG